MWLVAIRWMDGERKSRKSIHKKQEGFRKWQDLSKTWFWKSVIIINDERI